MIGQYETGVRNPKKKTLIRIAKALGISDSSILYDNIGEKAILALKDYALYLEQDNAINILGKALGEENIRRIVIALDKLNEIGKKEAVNRIEELSEIQKYVREE